MATSDRAALKAPSLLTIVSEHPFFASYYGNAERAKRRIRPKRHRMLWEVPYRSDYIEMFMNPQNMEISSSKITTPIRTKGGYMIQYWGEELDEMTIAGHTGSRGIEGIEYLRSIYRAEFQEGSDSIKTMARLLASQRKMSSYTVDELASIIQEMSDGGVNRESAENYAALVKTAAQASGYIDTFAAEKKAQADGRGPENTQNRKLVTNAVAFSSLAVLSKTQPGFLTSPNSEEFVSVHERLDTLAKKATSIVCHFQGASYRGFFTSLVYTEDATRQGIFTYQMGFKILERKGKRGNWMPWSRESNSDPINAPLLHSQFFPPHNGGGQVAFYTSLLNRYAQE